MTTLQPNYLPSITLLVITLRALGRTNGEGFLLGKRSGSSNSIALHVEMAPSAPVASSQLQTPTSSTSTGRRPIG